MAVTDRLMNDLRAQLTGATDGQINREIWATLNDFCRQGHVWRENVEIPLTAGVLTYDVAPVGTEVVFVYGVSSITLDVTGAVYDFGQITLARTPGASPGSIYADVALTPALTALDTEGLIPVDMWSEHHETIKHGVFSRMMAQPAKPYSNPQLAAFHMRAFRGETAMARNKVRTGGAMAPQTWRFPRWAGRRGA